MPSAALQTYLRRAEPRPVTPDDLDASSPIHAISVHLPTNTLAIIIANVCPHYSTISKSLPIDGTHATNIGRWVNPFGLTRKALLTVVGWCW
jgi:hypothetical protein